MIYVTNEDKPGFIGRFASVLGDAGVNIATFALGRDEQGGSAIALVVDRRRRACRGAGEGRKAQGRAAGDGAALLKFADAAAGSFSPWFSEKSTFLAKRTDSVVCMTDGR